MAARPHYGRTDVVAPAFLPVRALASYFQERSGGNGVPFRKPLDDTVSFP